MSCTCGNYKRRVTNSAPTYGHPDVIVCANCGDTPPEEVQANPNQELLDFCVENIAKWDDEYTHIRSDNTPIALFYSTGDWVVEDGGDEWVDGGSFDPILELDFSTNTPQVISKQEWIDAREGMYKKEIKLNKDGLVRNLEELGYNVTLEKKPEVQVGQVWLDDDGTEFNVAAIIGDKVVVWFYYFTILSSVVKVDIFQDFTLLRS